MKFNNDEELFDKYSVDDNDIKVGEHFLVDLYASELWEVEKTKKKIYNRKRRAWFYLKPIRFICRTRVFGSPNGYFSIKLLDENEIKKRVEKL